MTVQTETTSIKTLLAGVVDYAGLFPPARLDMPTTLGNYAEYLAGPEAWMLGRLVIPVSRLEEFEAHAATLLPGQLGAEPWQITALVAPAGDPGLVANLERVTAFNETHAEPSRGLARIGVLELRGTDPDAIDDALDRIPDALFPFFELAGDGDPRGLAAALTGSDAGAKIRTGGTEAAAYPSPERLTRFIAACVAADVPFKATAGLHHPLYHHSDAVGADEFGFLNVFTAAVLTRARKLDDAALRGVLTDESIETFVFGDAELSYRDHTVTVEEIEEARQHVAISFGSCSFIEPLDDLRSLKLL